MIRVLQAGVEKSGNYWLFNIIKELLLLEGIDSLNGNSTKLGIGNKYKEEELSYKDQHYIDTVETRFGKLHQIISSIYSEEVQDIPAFVENTNYIWTHSGFDDKVRLLSESMTHVVYLVRDPRDVAISKSKFAFKPYSLNKRWSNPGKSPEDYLKNRFERIMIKWANHVAGYSKAPNVHFIFFENLFLDFQGEIKRLADYLGISVTKEQLATIEQKVSADSLRKKDPNHVRKGKIGNWRNYKDNKIIDKMTEMNHGGLKAIGYPINRDDEYKTLTYNSTTNSSIPQPRLGLFKLFLIGIKTSKSFKDFFSRVFSFFITRRF